MQKTTTRVPATTANLGPGFDCLGVALQLYNTAHVERTVHAVPTSPMIRDAGAAFFKVAGCKPFSFHATIDGEVPVSRGLGSSVTVRLGVVMGLNRLSGRPLKPQEILDLVSQLEGHPDNSTPAMLGGFAVCAGTRHIRVPVSDKLHFIAVIPQKELETEHAREVLPARVSLREAVANQQRTALIAAAFCTGRLEDVKGLFKDHFHQPHRAKLLPYLLPAIDAAERAGALGAFLSGAGSTVMAIALQTPGKIGNAMLREIQAFGVPARVLVLKADNRGVSSIHSE